MGHRDKQGNLGRLARITLTTEKNAQKPSGSKDRFWHPRFWNGMNISGWFPLLWRNRFAVAPTRIAMMLIISSFAPGNSFLWALQKLFLGRRIDRTEIEHDPIFVIGHWRSGTTLLHELMVLDPRHTYPKTYDCFAPNHFLISGWMVRPWLWILLPSRRPMDNMAAGWNRPQEDEFALCNMGVRSPYLSLIFPNHPSQDGAYLELDGLSDEEMSHWKQAMVWFLKCLTVRDPKRIVLKSPAHTCRLKTLLELFPNARFVHIVRDPYVVFPSTVNLWKRLSRDQGLQVPKHEGLEEHVFDTFSRMYESFGRDRQLIPPARFCEVRYEDLVADPIEQMRRIYDRLELDEFDDVLPALTEYVAKQKDYKTNRYEISPQTQAEITRRWSRFIKEYGYESE